MARVELVKRWEFQLLLVCSFLLAGAGLWVALWRPPKLIEGEFLAREDRANAADEWLIGQTKTPVAEDRARAMVALGRIGDPRSLDALLDGLKDDIPRVRVSAAFAVGILQDEEYLATIGRKPEPRAVAALLAALEDRERAVVTNAVEALGKMGQPEVGGRLARSPAPLAITAVALARLGVRDAIPWLSQLLRSDDQNARYAGAVALNHLRAEPDEDISKSFLNLTRDRNGGVRVAVTRGLARARTTSAILAALVGLLGDRDAKARIEALRTLGELRQPATFRAMISGLGDPNENVRAAAAQAIGRLGNHEALAFLQSSRFGPSEVSFRAEVAAARLARSDVEYFEGMGDGVPEGYRSSRGVRAFSAALARFGGERAFGRLESLWRSSESYVSPVRGEILRMLVAAREEAAATLLEEALSDPNPEVRAAALELAEQPPLEACYRLFREARDGSPALQTRALDAAARSADRAAVKSLILEALTDESLRVRTRAVKHLNDIYAADHFEKIGAVEPARSDSDYQSLARSGRAPLRMETTAGTFAMSVDYRDAPLTADHFYRLAESGYFDGLEFGDVVTNAEAWFGTAEAGGRDYLLESIRPELNLEPFLRGSLGFVPAGRGGGKSGFFISLVPQPLKNSRYTNFGRLTSGDDVLDRITAGTKILRLRPLR